MEINSQHPIIIDEITQNKITSVTKELYKIYFNNKFKKILITKQWKWFTYILWIISSIFFIASFIVLITQVLEKKYYIVTDYMLLGLIGFSVFMLIIASISQTITANLKRKMRFFITSKIVSYYQSAAINNVKELEIINIINKFTIMPEKFLPESKYNTKVFNEKVITANYLNHNFNLGTILEKIVKQEAKKEKVVYNRYLYLTIMIPEYDFITTIKPETFIDKIVHRKEIKLESSEFEKKFAVEYDEPIKLRKLLSPKVMVKMIDFSKTETKLPNIFLNQNQVTIMIPYHNIKSRNSNQGDLLHFTISNDISLTTNSIITTIENDLTTALTLINWVKIMDLL